MARLTARGRAEWLRMERTETFQATIDPEPRTITVRTVRAYMSDGHLLERKSYLKADGTVDFDNGGWKDRGKTKTKGGWDIAQVKAALESKGWKVVAKS